MENDIDSETYAGSGNWSSASLKKESQKNATEYECRDCGGTVKWDREETTDEAPTCHDCNIIATWYNEKTGMVMQWTDLKTHLKDCSKLTDLIHEAFDYRYFQEVD
jgi:hypothetical protein